MSDDDSSFNFLVMEALFVLATVDCWRCHSSTLVLALGGLDDAGRPGTIVGVQRVDPLLQQRLDRDYPFFRLGLSKSMGVRAFFNHCEHCQALQGDHFLHSEPDGPFFALGELQPMPQIIEAQEHWCLFVDPLPYASLGMPLDDEDEDDATALELRQ